MCDVALDLPWKYDEVICKKERFWYLLYTYINVLYTYNMYGLGTAMIAGRE